MPQPSHLALIRALAVAPLTFASCDNAAGPTQPVTVRFAVRAGADDVVCGRTYPGLGTSGATFELEDLRFYVHDLALVDAGGNATPITLDVDHRWQGEGVVLLDFEDRTGACQNGTVETNAVATGHVAEGTYVGLRFTLGVPQRLDHLDTASAPVPLDLSGMFWGWTQGYKYLRIDGKTASGPWDVHLGAIGCSRSPSGAIDCSAPNLVQVDLPFVATRDVVVLDLAALTADSDLAADHPPSAGCLSDIEDPDCAAVFARLGLAFGGGSAGTQRVFTTAVTP